MSGTVLVPIEEGRDVTWAIRHVVELYRASNVRIHLLTVRTPLPQYVARFISREDREAFHRENGMAAMHPAIEALDAQGIPHSDHVLVGPKAKTIAEFARSIHCTHIVVSSTSDQLMPHLGLGSIASQLRHLIGAGGCQISEMR